MREVIVDREFGEWVLSVEEKVGGLYWVLVGEDLCVWGLVFYLNYFLLVG